MSAVGEKPKVEIRTLHYALLQWWWAEGVMHDDAYTGKVNDAIDKAVERVCEAYGVTSDTQLRCQWEGVQIYGESLEAVQKAGAELQSVLGRFKYVYF